mmetsp:Transcript_4350/g.6894  ORF Transcript_4350/g.6894 Transcript_4350/m.6894 type:complete len:140 (-) Transcript_4350:1024-1443(-)
MVNLVRSVHEGGEHYSGARYHLNAEVLSNRRLWGEDRVINTRENNRSQLPSSSSSSSMITPACFVGKERLWLMMMGTTRDIQLIGEGAQDARSSPLLSLCATSLHLTIRVTYVNIPYRSPHTQDPSSPLCRSCFLAKFW